LKQRNTTNIKQKNLPKFREWLEKRIRKSKNIDEIDYKNHKAWFNKVFNIKEKNIKNIRKYNRVIKINLGHENLKEKDILALITRRIYDEYEEYLNDFRTNWTRLLTKNFFLIAFAILTVWFLDEIDIAQIIPAIGDQTNSFFYIIRKFTEILISERPLIGLTENGSQTNNLFCIDTNKLVMPKTITLFVSSIVFYFLAKKIYGFVVSKTPTLKKNSSWVVLEELKSLIDRIEASVTESSGQSANTPSSSFFSFNFSREKSKIYPIASTREIEDKLIQILNKIQRSRLSSPLKFIIVFDELDKIDPVYNHITKAEQNIPEFETSTSFQGGSAMRDRKQNVLKLLGNMKLFMSQAKAKFVFISGRELNDASFADLVDREFAVSSIFSSTPINVDSFLKSSVKEKNILSQTEEYICGYLIPEKWYKKEAKNRYNYDNEENAKTKTYLYPNLRLYKKFLIETFGGQEVIEKDEEICLFINKTIVFLNQFSIYLTHICNGSPKKITLYFEKYIKMYIHGHSKNLFSRSEHYGKEEPKYCLSFKATDQQNIGFINYMIYPIIQTVINNSSHFGDKMLVSVSFLIDHIFKHHKGGFSHENIEHTPELLEIYSIPHMRNMINTILSFLKQNHATEILGGVYHYRFRQFIADEIRYNSKISEEISALFNFTLDESLPVKRYYYKQVAESEKKYLTLEEKIKGVTTPAKNQYTITLASQSEILGEIHLWDDEHNEAIQHYQTAFEIIKTELERTKTETAKDKLQLYVLLIRIALKLGLAKECKGYYDEAFVIYNTLIDYLTEFRSLKDADLGLNYFYEDNILVENADKSGEWKAKGTKIYHNTDGRILKKHLYEEDKFYDKVVLPFYKDMDKIKSEKIDFLVKSDYIVPGLSKILSPEKQEIISRITLFSEVKSIFQVILANLFVVEKIDHSGITQENLDLAEAQFKYIYLLTDSKDKFIQATDFYKKLASILFLKNYSNPKPHEFLQMWGFDIYETIDEFCYIDKRYKKMIAGKFPKEILKEFFVNDFGNLWENFITKRMEFSKVTKFISKTKQDGRLGSKEENDIEKLIWSFFKFGIDKLNKYFKEKELRKSKDCYEYCDKNRGKNHPCYACNYASKSLDILKRIFTPNVQNELLLEKGYIKKKSYFFKLLEYFKKAKTNSNHLLVLASVLRVKADALLSCVDGGDNELNSKPFLSDFFNFIKKYYDNKQSSINEPTIIDKFIEKIESKTYSKLEKSILYYWLSAEYFHLSRAPIDANENLTKILIIFDKYLVIDKELNFLDEEHTLTNNPFEHIDKAFEIIKDTIVRRILKNGRTSNDNVNQIEIQNLRHILRNRPEKYVPLSNLSTRSSIEEVLFSYCKLELNTIDIENENLYLDCYKSTLLSEDRLSFTIQEKIHALEFKERMNSYIFKKIFEQFDEDGVLDFYHPELEKKYFKFLNDYFCEGKELESSLKSLPKIVWHGILFGKLGKAFSKKMCETLKIQRESTDTRAQLLHFLISDSLYCLTQIVEILSSGSFSNFSHSFIGDIYHQISKWATLYQCFYTILKKSDKRPIEFFIDRIGDKILERSTIMGNTLDNVEEFKDDFKELVENVAEMLKKEKLTDDRAFETDILDDIGIGNRQFLVPIYSVAMALKHYHKAIGVNSGGKEYKEMIKEMYIVDDDISNGMHNFWLALERYSMNCTVIEKKMDKLRKYYKESLSHDLINYLKDTTME